MAIDVDTDHASLATRLEDFLNTQQIQYGYTSREALEATCREILCADGFASAARMPQAQDAEASDAAFLESVLASSGDCIKVLDLDANLVFMSEGGKGVMEVGDFNTIKGCPWPNFWEGEGRDAALRAVTNAKAGKPGHFVGEANTMLGNPRWWDVRVTPIVDSEGTVKRLLSVSRDITSTRHAEMALRNSEAYWRGLFNNLQEAFILGELVRDTAGKVVDWRYLDVNPAWGTMVGLDVDMARGNTVRGLFPAIESIWIDEMREVVTTRQQTSFLRPVGPLGRWYEGRAFALEDDKFAVMFLEVTRRKRADTQRQALIDLSDTLRKNTDPAQMCHLAATIIGCTLTASRAGYATMAQDARTIHIGRDWTTGGAASVSGMHDAKIYGRHFDDLANGDIVAIHNVDEDARTRDTALALRNISVGSLINVPLIERGRLVAFFFVSDVEARAWEIDEIDFVRNVSERTWAEVERTRAEAETRKLADTLAEQVEIQTRERNRLWQLSDDPFLIADLEGHWVRINPAWTRILGWNEAELLGRTFAWITHPEDDPLPLDQLVRADPHDDSQILETRLRAKDGSYWTFAWTIVRADDRLYCVARDVTQERALTAERIALEEALRQSQKMEAVGQLTGGIAHDFNNLLTGITGSLELLGTRVDQGRLGELPRYVSAAQGAAKRAAALTHRLLAFSRRQTLDPKPVNINRLVSGMEELLRRTVGPEISIEVVGAVGLWSVMVDGNQLENALLNLCINARDAMPHGGRITLETANQWLDDSAGEARSIPAGQYVALCVSDTGTGMSRDTAERAFDPFFTTKPLGLGTGLGLSMVYGFVRQSGGQVRVYSEIDAGTTMRLYFPRHYGDTESIEAEHPGLAAAPAEQGLTVLVVDDEPTIRMLVAEVLGELGYVVVEASDGPTGLNIIESNMRIDLLVSDVGLPGGMNGRQLADAARERRPKLDILFITGYAENAVVGNGYLEPGMHILTKPFTMEALSHRIATLIGKQ